MDIDKANTEATQRMMDARPIATTMAKAIEVVPGMHENMLLHAGPPVTWERMAGPMKGAMIGALIFEGKAKNGDEAEKMLKSGKIEFAPCHDHMCVGPMAGVISPSMLVYVVENKTHRHHMLLQPERRPRQSAAHGRLQPGGAGEAALDGIHPGSDGQGRPGSHGRDRYPHPAGQSAAHGR